MAGNLNSGQHSDQGFARSNAMIAGNNYQILIIFQVFVAFVGTMHSFGSLGALTGLIIARLKESKGDLQLSKDEETWFGKYIKL